MAGTWTREPTAVGAMGVIGRDAELGRIGAWLRDPVAAAPAAGVIPAVLAIEGEPGIGKTALWTEAVRGARDAGWQVLSCRPGPSDAGLPHVGLADLLSPVPGPAFAGRPPPQRRPRLVALLREEAGEGDLEPRSVGTGLTALLTSLAAGQPLLLAVDDAQWLDTASARALGFALRRLDGRPARLLATVRIGEPAGPAGGLTTVTAALDREAVARLAVQGYLENACGTLRLTSRGLDLSNAILTQVLRLPDDSAAP